MKKLFALLLAAIMVLSMAACGNQDALGDDTVGDDYVEIPESAEEILKTVWAEYGEEDRFAVVGGNPENQYMDGPAAWDMANAENLPYSLLIPAELMTSIDQAATMVHMMNANTFTCGVVHLTEGTDAAAFASAMRDAIQGNQWMCGFPEKLFVGVESGEYVIIAFGHLDPMDTFQQNLMGCYSSVEVLHEETIG